MKKNIVTASILILIAGLGAYKYYDYKHPHLPSIEIARTQTEAPAEKTISTKPGKTKIDIGATTPINGTLKGVIEVGASGFNSFVVNIDKEKNWELVSKDFGESLAYEGFATVQDVQLGLKKYLTSMFNKGVGGKNAHFVMSSGALKNEKTKLIADAIEKMGYVVNRVSAEQEGKFALKALLPKNYVGNSFTVDIGSGNTKVSWYNGSKLNSLEGVGAKYYQIPKTDPEAYEQIKGLVSQVPKELHKYVFIIGGAPYQLAKQVRQGNERYTVLEDPDFYSGGDDVKLKSGINLYRAVVDAAAPEAAIFDWDANFTIGFLLSLN